MYPAVLLMYFISAAVIHLALLALTVKVSMPCNKNGVKCVVLCNTTAYPTGISGSDE